MVRTITAIVILFFGFIGSAQSQFEQGMGKAFKLWGEGKPQEASAMFERIASADKSSWLPNYYVALVNTTSAFQTKDKEQISALLAKSQQALDVEIAKDSNNAELLVMQALIHTAWVASDPMTYAMALSPQIMELYTKASALAPQNPRVVFGKAEYEIGGAMYFGTDITPMCNEVNRAIELFANFKPETPFHPTWGLDRATAAQQQCAKK
jgi:hypothetical protein